MELGKLLKEYTPSPLSKIRNKLIILSVVNLIIVIAGAVAFKFDLSAGYSISLLGILVLIATIWGWYRLFYILPGLKIQIYEDGFVFQNSKTTISANYQDVAKFFDYTRGQFVNGQFNVTQRSYKIELKNKQEFKINDDIVDVGQAAGLIENQVIRILLPVAIQKYEHGEEIVFDHVAVSKQGIKIKSKLLAWSDVLHLRYNQDQLVVKKKGGLLDWGSIEYHVLPNQAILEPILKLSGVEIKD